MEVQQLNLLNSCFFFINSLKAIARNEYTRMSQNFYSFSTTARMQEVESRLEQ